MFSCSHISVLSHRIIYRLFLTLTLVLTSATAVPLLAAIDHGDSCDTASWIEANGSLAAHHDYSGDQDYFRVDLASPGLLVVELASPADLRLQLLGMGCRGNRAQGIGYLERSDVRHVLEVRRRGTYFVKVVGSSTNGAAYEMFTTFLPSMAASEKRAVTHDSGGGCTTTSDTRAFVFDSDRQFIVSEDTDEIDTDVIIIRAPQAGFLKIEAEGAEVVGSLYSGRSCTPEVQLRGDVWLTAGEKILSEVSAGEYFLRLAAGPGAKGTYKVRIAFLKADGK